LDLDPHQEHFDKHFEGGAKTIEGNDAGNGQG
jgi:hypothetical protein